MKSLEEVAREISGVDKLEHGYLPTYERMVGHLRDQECTIMEVGVASGVSIDLWLRAFPRATVIGVDRKDRVTQPLDMTRATLYEKDVTKAGALDAIVGNHGPFDLVIDDSGHNRACAAAIASAVWPHHIKPGGWFVIEDTNAPDPDGFHAYVERWVALANHGYTWGLCGRPFWKHDVAPISGEIEQVIYRYGMMAVQRFRP